MHRIARRVVPQTFKSHSAVPTFQYRMFSIEKGAFVTENLHYIKMPSIMDAKEGTIDKWLKKEGESFSNGESLCEISLSDFSLAVDHDSSGIIAEIIAGNGKTVEADHPIASYVLSNNEYLEYVQQKRDMVVEQEKMSGITESMEEKNKKPDTMVLMREIKHLIQSGAIQEGSEFAKKMQSLARKGNPELMSVFMASFDGTSFNEDTFDVKFFLDNAKDVIADAEK